MSAYCGRLRDEPLARLFVPLMTAEWPMPFHCRSSPERCRGRVFSILCRSSLTTLTTTCLRMLLPPLCELPELSSAQPLTSCILTFSIMRSSLSLKEMLVIGLAVGGPRPRQLAPLAPAPPPPIVCMFLGVPPESFVDFLVEVRVPMRGDSQPLNNGKIIGRLVVTTAMKDSRTAHDPAS